MPRRPAFEVIFDLRAVDHMEAIQTKYHSPIRRTVEEQLPFEPETAIVVTRNGKPVALLTSILEDDDLDSLLLTHDRKFVRLLAEARERVRAGQYLTNEQFWKELERRRPSRPSSSRRTRTVRR